MESQRCPMCGQANPAHLEECQYCQARLKPLWVEPSEDSDATIEDRITKSKTPIEPDEPLIPEWLMASRLQSEEEEIAQTEETEAYGEEIPPAEDFLAEIFAEEPVREEEEDYPQWLRSLRDDSTLEQAGAQATENGEQDEPIPFWLDTNPPEEGGQFAEPTTPAEKVPPFTEFPFEGIDLDRDLFSAEGELEPEIAPGEQPQQSVPPFEGMEELFPLEAEVEESTPQSEVDEALQKAEHTAFSAEGSDWMNEIPSWLESLPGQEWEEAEQAAEEMPPEFFQGVVPPFEETEEMLSEIEFPAWLEDAESSGELELDTVIESLAPAASETMIKEVMPEEVTEQKTVEPSSREEEIPIESVGPLHGLRGVLPAEPLIAEPKRPSQALSELLVTEKQRAQAELFLKLIEEEGKPKAILPSKGLRPHLLWRLLIFLALVTAAVVGLIANPFSTSPQELSVGVFDAMQAVSQLPAGAPVLLIVDMEGSDFAEMQAVSAALLDQMMIKGAFFVVVSADQNGVLQADRLLREVSRLQGHSYQSSSGWVNLGYLPGGAGGMQAFSRSPAEILPNTIDGEAAWQNDRLKGIQALSDFALVTVITEDSTRARQWIEQLKEQVAASRLLFAVSAQVEPVLRPYYEANPRQLQSLIAGIRDGAIYETQASRQGYAMQLWNAYALVVLVGIALILSGSIVYALIALFSQRKPLPEGKKP